MTERSPLLGGRQRRTTTSSGDTGYGVLRQQEEDEYQQLDLEEGGGVSSGGDSGDDEREEGEGSGEPLVLIERADGGGVVDPIVVTPTTETRQRKKKKRVDGDTEKGGEATSDYDSDTDTDELSDIDRDKYISSLTTTQRQEEIREGLRTGSLFIVGLVAVGVMLIYLRFILIPLVFSRFLVYFFQPLMNLMTGKKKWPFFRWRLRAPRWVAVLVCFVVLVFLIAILCWIIYVSIDQVLDKKDVYIGQIDKWMKWIDDWAIRVGYTPEEWRALVPEVDWGDYAVSAVSYLAAIVPQAALILLFVTYMLLDHDDKKTKSDLRRAIDGKIRKYIVVHTIISFLTGVFTWLPLLMLGVDLSLFFGLMAFVTNYIPNIGTAIGIILPMPVVILDPDSTVVTIVLAFALPTFFQFILGQVIEPRVLGAVMDMPALTVLVCLMFWGSVWGIIGAVISVPLTVTIKIGLENIDHPMPRFLAKILDNLGLD